MAPAKPIAVGISNTPASGAALMWAAARADRLKSPLAVVNVVDDRWMASEVLPYFEVLRESGLGLLKEAGGKVSAAYPGLKVSLQLLEGGVGSALGAYSKDVAMLVLGTSGHARGALTVPSRPLPRRNARLRSSAKDRRRAAASSLAWTDPRNPRRRWRMRPPRLTSLGRS
jgi:nucleotide-binding universal stress UspA family protein